MTRGSSTIPSILVFSGANYVTGPTGSTGPEGATGPSLIGSTGASGPRFISASIQNGVLGITYESGSYFFNVTGPAGGTEKVQGVVFRIGETGGSTAFSIFNGYDSDPYKLTFKTIRIIGQGTGGISGNAFYISSPGTTNSYIGITGSFLYGTTDGSGFGNVIEPTNDTNTNYYRSLLTPSGSFGLTLDTFTYKVVQNYDVDSAAGSTLNINWIRTTSYSNFSSALSSNDVKTSQVLPNGYTFNRTDQGTFINAVNTSNNRLTPKMSFRSEGITLGLISKVNDPIQVDINGSSIAYQSGANIASRLGSCCYCSADPSGSNSVIHRSCIDYTTQNFCNSIKGNFGFKTCNERYLSNDCYSGGACCVNGVCLETTSELCSKVYGTFYANVKCKDLKEGCPSSCQIEEASCCVDGVCYSLPAESASEVLCNSLNGSYGLTACSGRNCCTEGFLGACCVGTDCYDDITPIECKNRGGVYQGPGTICTSSSCCTDSIEKPNSFTTKRNFNIPETLSVGDYFEGGIVAGFVGYPAPSILTDTDNFFARGEVISELENYLLTSVKRYVAVNGVFNSNLRCNCSNFSPSRYVDYSDITKTNGKVLNSDVKSLSGVLDAYNLTFYNRLSDACLVNQNKPCNDNGSENRKFGFNSISAYKQLCKKIHGTDIPNAWILVVSPNDFSTNNVSFGMSNAVNGFEIPVGFENYSYELWQNNNLTPYGTTVFDGLLNTRLLDETSIERNNWFIPNNYITNGKNELIDPLAYHRFKHTNFSYWQSEIDQDKIIRDSGYFKEKYRELWYAVNNKTTALYQISDYNNNSYNGYSDWYIPSALELNIIQYNMDKINLGIINNTDGTWNTISEKYNYWTSTSGGKLLKTNSTVQGLKIFENPNYAFERSSSTSDTLLDTWKNYKLAQAHRAYAQNMGTGKMNSYLKSETAARIRGCRMIPVYFKNGDFSNQFEFSFKTINTCTTCR